MTDKIKLDGKTYICFQSFESKYWRKYPNPKNKGAINWALVARGLKKPVTREVLQKRRTSSGFWIEDKESKQAIINVRHY